MNWIDGWNLPGRIRFRKVSRTRMSPCSPPIAVNRTLKTGSDGKDRHYYSFSGRIGRLYSGVNNKRNEYIRTLPGGSDGGRYCYRNIGKLQRFHRESQKQENFQRFSHCRIGIEWQHRSSLAAFPAEEPCARRFSADTVLVWVPRLSALLFLEIIRWESRFQVQLISFRSIMKMGIYII